MKIVAVGAILVCVLVASGCLTPEMAPETTVEKQFPLTVGSHWMYATFDSLTQRRDTVLVTVVSQRFGATSDTLYVCRYRHRTFTDSSIIHAKDDTIVFETDETPPVDFLLPFTSVENWQFDRSSAVSILGVGTDTVPSGPYVETIHIRQQSLLPNDASVYDYWIAPGFGVVQMYDGTSPADNNTVHKTTWVLLSCWIAP